MADIDRKELDDIGKGSLFKHNKLYIPARVARHLGLNVDDEVIYYQILDPNHRNIIVIEKGT